MTAAPYTLTHSDYRLVNMLLGGTEGERRVTVLDWQRVALGKGPIDVAFFTVLSLEPETRRAWQWDLVERYHAGLLEHGVRDYSLEELSAGLPVVRLRAVTDCAGARIAASRVATRRGPVGELTAGDA